VELYLKVRLACAEGLSQRSAAKRFNVSRDTVRKMLSFSAPPGYRRQAAPCRPKLDGFVAIIDGWLDGDRGVPRKQRHTAKRVFDWLRKEHGFTGGYTIIVFFSRFEFASEPYQKIDGGHPLGETFLHHPAGHDPCPL
jgi:transposase